jgi:hypothetical protein
MVGEIDTLLAVELARCLWRGADRSAQAQSIPSPHDAAGSVTPAVTISSGTTYRPSGWRC